MIALALNLIANTPTIDNYPPEEATCIIYATKVRKELVPPQYAGLCTFNAAYVECMSKVEK